MENQFRGLLVYHRKKKFLSPDWTCFSLESLEKCTAFYAFLVEKCLHQTWDNSDWQLHKRALRVTDFIMGLLIYYNKLIITRGILRRYQHRKKNKNQRSQRPIWPIFPRIKQNYSHHEKKQILTRNSHFSQLISKPPFMFSRFKNKSLTY